MKQIKSIVFLLLIISMSTRQYVVAEQATCIETTRVNWPVVATRVIDNNRVCVVLFDGGGSERWWRFSTSTTPRSVITPPEIWQPLDPDSVASFRMSQKYAPEGFSGSDIRLELTCDMYNEAPAVAGFVQSVAEWDNMRLVSPVLERGPVGPMRIRVWWRVDAGVRTIRPGMVDYPMDWIWAPEFVRYHSPRIQNQAAGQPWNNWFPYNANVGLVDALSTELVLEDVPLMEQLRDAVIVTEGWGNGNEYHREVDPSVTVANPGFFVLSDIDGAPMNDGTQITGIGHTLWRQNVILNSGNVTEFSRNVTVRTTQTPTITLIYDTPELANTPFTDGSHNGGTGGWSNLPLRAVVSTENDDGTHLVDGYYFNQISDEDGNTAHGDARKASASLRYDTNSDSEGTSVTGVMVDDAKSTELSATTEPITVKIDMTNPTAAVSYELATEQLINESYDTLSGIQSTLVALVKPGDPAPDESDYHDFSEWRSLVGNDGEYDIYVIVTDNAGNRATTTLANQFLTGTATDVNITKTVAGKYGSYHKAFEVSIFLEDDQGVPVSGAYVASSSLVDVADYTVTITDGVGNIHIKHDETITLKGLPQGHMVTVKETDAAVTDSNSEYSVTYNGASRENGFSEVLTGSTAIVLIRNTRETIPDMGIVENNSVLFLGSTAIVLIRNTRETIPDMGIVENNSVLFRGSTLLLLTVVMVAGKYYDKKRSAK